MLKRIVVLTAALLTAVVFGLSGVSAGAAGVAKILFCVFLVTFVASLLIGLLHGKGLERE